VLQRQVADREANGAGLRVAGAHFPGIKTLEDFNADHRPSLRRDVLAHLATTTFILKAENVMLLGPPSVGKTHLAIGLGIKAAYSTARLEAELKRLRRYRVLIIEEVGYLPFDADAANLFFQLVASG